MAVTPCISRAQAPSGQFTFNFDPGTTPLIDLSGNFDTSQSLVGAGGTTTPLIYSVSLTNDPSGRLHSSGAAIIQVGDDVVVGAYTASGNVSGGGLKPTRVSLVVHLFGTGPIASVETDFNIVVRYNLTLNVEDGNLQGTARGTARFNRVGSGVVREDFATVALPGGVDGSWSATLTILAATKLGGGGYITLPNGRTLQGLISGSYATSTGISKIKLTGTDGDKGFNVTFTTTSNEDGLQLETARGRILGQSIFE